MNASDNTHGEFREETALQTGWSRKAAWRRRQVLTASRLQDWMEKIGNSSRSGGLEGALKYAPSLRLVFNRPFSWP